MERGDAQSAVTGTVRDVAPVVIERVTTDDERRLFRELVGYHETEFPVTFSSEGVSARPDQGHVELEHLVASRGPTAIHDDFDLSVPRAPPG